MSTGVQKYALHSNNATAPQAAAYVTQGEMAGGASGDVMAVPRYAAVYPIYRTKSVMQVLPLPVENHL